MRSALALLALGLVDASTASAAPGRTSFAPGTWTGSARLTGRISRSGLSERANGTIKVAFRVAGSRVAGGTMTYDVAVRGSAVGHPFTGRIFGRLRMSGSASRPQAHGELTVTEQVLGRTLQFSIPADGFLSGASGSCDRMSGDTAVLARRGQRQAGLASYVTVNFVAVRRSGSGC